MDILKPTDINIQTYKSGSVAEVTVTGKLPKGYTYYILVSVTTEADTYYSEYIEYVVPAVEETDKDLDLTADNATFFIAITEQGAVLAETDPVSVYSTYK